MNVVSFHMEHLRQLRLQPAQMQCMDAISDEIIEQHERLEAYTVMVGSEVIAVAGLMEFWPGRSMGWSYIGVNAGPYMFGLTRRVREYLASSPVKRIECYVDPDFEAGMRWAHVLGFDLDAPRLRAFLPDGRDQALFSRVLT